MKLSEAILLSIGVVRNEPRLFLSPAFRDIPGVCGCAIGTALYSLGYHRGTWEVTGAYDGIGACEKIWPWTKVKLRDGFSIAQTISIRHGQGESRESLAQWIATIEPAEPTTTSTPHPISHVEEIKI